MDNRNTSGDHSVLPQDDSRKPAAHVRYLSQLTEISFGWVPLNQPTLVKSALTPFRVKRVMDCLLCSHILFVLKLSFQSLSQYSAANVVLYIVNSACTDVPSEVRGQKTRNCDRVCQNYIMLSLSLFVFVCLFLLFCFNSSFWRHCLSVDISENAGKFFVFVFFPEHDCTHLNFCWTFLFSCVWFSQCGHFGYLFTHCSFVNAVDSGEGVRG